MLTSHLTIVVSELVRSHNEACGLAKTSPRGMLEGFLLHPECLERTHGDVRQLVLSTNATVDLTAIGS
jgi:hypothetical protein